MKRILVLDDNEDILFVMQLLLEEEGYEVKCIYNPSEFMPLMLEFKPNLVILDIQLGTQDGRALCELLQHLEDTKEIPILMMSAKTNITVMGGYSCKAEELISKPFDIEQMARTIAYHLNK
ncbi:response regulator [Pedobacter mucosus]|uniref:response regulator n=1 Tax=Pedobacter mucosus TaxID=2895286 RepID=UPI001EE4CAB9|nr:response regulator [Pedobacter mucosus]UKT62160.1 response regulator [Pedobacter mucosus]